MATRIDREVWERKLRACGVGGPFPTEPAFNQRLFEAVQARPPGQRALIADARVTGLVWQLQESGATSFFLEYRRAGKLRRYGLGSISDLGSIKRVWAAAESARADVLKGVDPIQAAEAKRIEAELAKSNTLRAYLEQVYGPKVLKHQKDGGAPKIQKRSRKLKPSGTWERILTAWEPLLSLELTAISRDAIESHLADRKAETKSDGSQRLALATMRKDWAVLRALLGDAKRRGQLAAIPIDGRPEPIRKGKATERVRYLGQRDTPDTPPGEGEAERFEKALADFQSDEMGGGDFLRCVAGIALNTAMRRGEIVRLTDKLLNLRERRIDLPAGITKGDKARIVYLTDEALAALKLWKLRDSKTGALFPGDPERWEVRITQREWPELCAAAKLEDFHFHDLRHTAASWRAMAGWSAFELKEFLGHQSLDMVERYAHLGKRHVRELAIRFERPRSVG